ncbi:glycosyltransferase [Methanobacterium sp.]|uniref:glycosyltransferase family 2 protein n=1 Tax=Methanobacterium sp. TaxID=2164 RepID=UPI003C75A4DB
MPKVSIIIPCYNQAQYLDDAIDSILAQTFHDFEIIIVDDGSDDEISIKILDDYKRPKTKLIRTSNQGPSSARNKGIKIAKGDYILPIDADDKIGDTYLEKAVDILDKYPQIGIVYCEAELFGDRSGKWNLPEYTFPHVLLHNSIFCTAMFRKSDWKKVGGYKKEMEFSSEDWEFWLSLIEMGLEVHRIPETLFYYRIKKVSRRTTSLSHHEHEMRLNLLKFHRQLYENNIDFIIESYYNLHLSSMKSNSKISKLNLEIKNSKEEISKLNLEIKNSKAEINILNQKISKKDKKIMELKQIKSSRSWKMTEPFRKMGFLMRKLKRIS